MIRSSDTRWGLPSRTLHWLTVLLITVTVPIGAYMGDLPTGMQKLRVFALHKSIGVTILGLVVLRALWRLVDSRPQKAAMPPWQAQAANTLQLLLYVLLFAVPLCGWAANSAAGFPLQWFGLVNLPSLTAADKARHELLLDVHGWLAWTLVIFATGHGAMALKHHFIDKDHTLRSMLPLPRGKGGGP